MTAEIFFVLLLLTVGGDIETYSDPRGEVHFKTPEQCVAMAELASTGALGDYKAWACVPRAQM